MSKKVVLLSGGLDSTTLLGMVVKEFGSENVVALTIFYGQRHDREIKASNDVVKFYNVEHIVNDLSPAFKFSDTPLLKNGKGEIPNKSYAEQLKEKPGIVTTYVPFRNGLFLSFATTIAFSIGADTVYYGAHADDAAGSAYPDCTPSFIESMKISIFEGTGHKVMLKAPFFNSHKSDIVRMGTEIGVPYELTWSCYRGGEKACGVCATCIDRKEAFRLNGLVDPIEYEN